MSERNKIFENNKQCLLLICEIVDNYRKQKFFVGSSKLSILLKNMNSIADYILSGTDYREYMGELEQILPALLQAQANQDYILQADILEGDLLPFLQKFQIKLQENSMQELPDFFEKNMRVLKQKSSSLFENLQKTEVENNKFHIRFAINGQPTVQGMNDRQSFFMHSTINPEREAQLLIESVSAARNYVVFGMELGYHILALLKKYPECNVTVLESEKYLLQHAFQYNDWTAYLQGERITIVYEPDILKLVSHLKQMTEYELFVHYPAVQAVEEEQVRLVLEDFFITTSSMREQKDYLDANFEAMGKYKLPDCRELKNLFYKKNVVIVGAGPSVNCELKSLKKYRSNITVFATGHIVKTLLREGITPDVMIITDPQPQMYEQLKDLNIESIPLILLSTASASVLNYYKGSVYIAYQKGYKQAEDRAKQLGVEMFQTGGSVTTTALDIALQYRASKVIFVGVDLAYTGGNSHAEGVGRKITGKDNLRKVMSCSGEEVFTSKNLDVYRKWIERRIANVKDTVIYNTGNGANIKGAQWSTWEEILDSQ